MNLSGTGIWSAGLTFHDGEAVADAAAELEDLGYTSLWIPSQGAGSFAKVERLLTATKQMVVATGILNLWVVTPEETAQAHADLSGRHGHRFLLGIGVSHAELLETLAETVHYEKPLQAMATFLDGLDTAPTPVVQGDRVLAALGPKMLQLAGERAGGAHPYNVTPEHTAIARAALGPSRLLVPEQAVAFTTDAAAARRAGRTFLEHYLGRPNYANNLRRLGFTDDDFAHGGSDRLIDALVVYGDEDTIAARIREHRDAGADSICIQIVTDGEYGGMVDLHSEAWRALAPALTAA